MEDEAKGDHHRFGDTVDDPQTLKRALELVRSAYHQLVRGQEGESFARLWQEKEVEEEAFRLCVARQGVSGMVVSAALASGLEVSAKWKDLLARTFAFSAHTHHQLQQLSSSWSQEGLEVVGLKAASLLHTVYHERWTWRSFGDIDLLLLPEQKELFLDWALNQEGFAEDPSAKDNLKNYQERCEIDYHTNWLGSVGEAFSFPNERIWLKKKSFENYDFEGFYRLPPEHEWIQLAFHGFKHNFISWKWYLDLDLLWSEVDREKLESLLDSLHARRVVSYTLYLLGRETGRDYGGLFTRLNWVERWFLQRTLRRENNEYQAMLLLAFSVPTLAGKLRYLLKLLESPVKNQSWSERAKRLFYLLKNYFLGGRA